ncbi:MAG: hypothetical protein A2289_13080 [Deltaproteobacteria bacterium RIFOXYA12_FULL_58_15]|nr:MAG: hypothetical protein A2289_13080 [Deltaproteobacteria bacterium RIFOXYA12_FULL_58_15]OGR09426.1 MAG: hypothetical protein A2341_18060 [Deltaproteobacteria bacterium RIFOXYB12_FULL_58_9]
MRADAEDAQRRAEFALAGSNLAQVSPEEGLRQLWDLLDLLNSFAGPTAPDRTITKFHSFL